MFAYIRNGYTHVFKFFFMFLQVFQTYVASALTVSNVCCSIFYLDVAKVDQTLHMLQ
jgi:hypothetical protein